MPTKIPYCDEVLEVSGGCTKCSPGCQHCWAIKEVWRMAHNPLLGDKWQGLVDKTEAGYNWTGKIKIFEDVLEKPLQRKKPTTYFIDSKADLFHPKVPDEFADRVFDVIHKCPQHTFLYLTKRPGIMAAFIGDGTHWKMDKMPNLHIGVSISTQKEADEKIPILLQISAVKRFISLEPMLEGIDLKLNHWVCSNCGNWTKGEILDDNNHCGCDFYEEVRWKNTLDQVVIGAESINGRPGRECKIEWIQDVVQQCKSAGVKTFVKQLVMWEIGGKLYEEHDPKLFIGTEQNSVLVRDMNKFPADLRIQETI